MAQQILVDLEAFHVFRRAAENLLENVAWSSIDPAAGEPINQKAPSPVWIPVGIHFDDDTQFQCLMQPEERDRLHREYFDDHTVNGGPYTYRFSPDDVDRQLCLRISDIHHLY